MFRRDGKWMGNGWKAKGLWPRFILHTSYFIIALLALCGCETAGRRDWTVHRIEKWEVGTNWWGGPKRYLVFRETWADRHGVRFAGFFTDPSVGGFADGTTNQSALGGGTRVTFGTASSKVDSAGISAAGGAVGDVIGEAVKAAVK